jgi:hypothetical protein
MYPCRTFLLCLITMVLLAACTFPAASVPVSLAPVPCGSVHCEAGETAYRCPQDCSMFPLAGQLITTSIEVQNVGKIAVLIASPSSARFAEGAGVVLVVSPIYPQISSFMTTPDVTSLGLIQVTYLWPGSTDRITQAHSDGTFDDGGAQSLEVLQGVIEFATGHLPDVDDRPISSLISLPVLTGELGLYAYSDAGFAAVDTLATYGDPENPLVQYYIGRENPTQDILACLELGYWNSSGLAVFNPLYHYPASYSPTQITPNYSSARWDPSYTDSQSSAVGRPYLDLDGSKSLTAGDFIFSGNVPVINGKRMYSAALTEALLKGGSLSLPDWPPDLATPQEAADFWGAREFITRYNDLRNNAPDLEVMLVFAQNDSLQVAADKPHIHQAFQEFRFEDLYWVRLNPDRSYVQSLLPNAGMDFPDTPANTQPSDWSQINSYAYPASVAANTFVPLAAVAEMADRTHTDRWDENLGAPLYVFSASTPTP